MNRAWRVRTTRPASTAATWAVLLLVAMLQGFRDRAATPAADLVLGCAVAAVVIDLVWSWWAAGRAEVEVVENPTDGTAGEPVACDIRVSRLRGSALLAMTTALNRPTVHVRRDEVGRLDAVGSRGRALGAGFQIVATGPFALAGVRRRFAMEPLVQPLLLAPRPEPWPDALARLQQLRTRGEGDGVRGVRPYVPGDRMSSVHWPSSARSGELLVREPDIEQLEVVVAVELLGPATRGESTAGGALWLVRALLAAGDRVVLITLGEAGLVRNEVADTLDAGRQLAEATFGILWPDDPPEDVTVVLR